MKIIGLTGSIASGKNFIAEIFQEHGAVVFDADLEVHKLLESDEFIFDQIKNYFPKAIIDGKINRNILGKIVFFDAEKLLVLEEILHKKVRNIYNKFLEEARENQEKMIVLNIPLLLEKKGYDCDKIVSIIVSKSLQIKRFLSREKTNNSNYSEEKARSKFEKIYSKQLNNLERKEKSDFIIDNNLSKDHSKKQVKEILSKI